PGGRAILPKIQNPSPMAISFVARASRMLSAANQYNRGRKPERTASNSRAATLTAKNQPHLTIMDRPRVVVFGPAYLDRVLRVDRPLVDREFGAPIDQSVEGQWKFGLEREIELVDPAGDTIVIDPPLGWPGPTGRIELARRIHDGPCGVR